MSVPNVTGAAPKTVDHIDYHYKDEKLAGALANIAGGAVAYASGDFSGVVAGAVVAEYAKEPISSALTAMGSKTITYTDGSTEHHKESITHTMITERDSCGRVTAMECSPPNEMIGRVEFPVKDTDKSVYEQVLDQSIKW